MTRSAPQPGDTQATHGAPAGSAPGPEGARGPWGAPGPAGTWWHGDEPACPPADPLQPTEEFAVVWHEAGEPDPERPAAPTAEPTPAERAAQHTPRPEQVAAHTARPAPADRVAAHKAGPDQAAAHTAGPEQAAAHTARPAPAERAAAHAVGSERAAGPARAIAAEPAARAEPEVGQALVRAVPERRALPERVVPTPAPPVDEPAFWIPSESVPRDAVWPAPELRAGRSRAGYGRTAHHPAPRRPRRPGPALTGLVVFSLLAAFFGWVSAEPLWLAAGRGDRGTATVTRCTGAGVGQRCVGAFAAADGRFTAPRVTLLGVASHERHEGATVAARMVDPGSRRAYVGDDGLALHLRWGLGLLLVLLCGAGIIWATGATRLETRRARRWATLASLAAPLAITLGFLAAAT